MLNHKKLVISFVLLMLLCSSVYFSKSSFCELNTHAGTNTYAYLALGDSYSAGQTPYGIASGRSYADVIMEKLASAGMLKSYSKEGVSGYKTTDVINQLSEMKRLIYDADVVTIDIGMNDVLLLPEVEAYRFNFDKGGFDVVQAAVKKEMPKIKSNIVEIIRHVKAVNPDKDPVIYMMGYFNAFPNSPEFLPVIEKLNDAIRSASVETQVHYVNSMPAIDKKILAYLPGDIHPTVEGYEAIAEVFWEQIIEDLRMDMPQMPTDINGHWAKENIMKYMEKGVANGYGDGSFKPDNPVTRAEFVTIMNNYLNWTDMADTAFTDIPENAWYKVALQRAVKGGYILGYADGTFRPDQYVTRQEAAVIIAKIMGIELKEGDNEVARFADGDAIPLWSVDSLNGLVRNGIFLGYPDNTIRCNGNITRAEVLSLLEHMGG